MNLLKSPEKDRIPKKDILLQNLIPKNMPVGLCEIFFNKSGKPILLDPQSFTGDGKHPMQNSISRSVRVQIKKMNGYLVRCTYANPDQIAITIQLIFQFLRLPGNTILDLRNIGVITFFRLQAQVLKSWFFHNGLYLYKATENSIKILPEKNNLETTLNNWAKLLYKIWISQNLEIGTVERFQGREKDFIITNTVYHPTINTGRVHPAFKDFRRLNVVLTRPKSLHIIISRSMKKNEEATWLYDLFHGNKYPNDYISIPKSGFFLNLDWKLEPAVKLQSLSYRNEEKCTGSIFSTIEKITGQKINLGERGALRIDLDDSYESSSTEIELHTSIESSLNSIAKAFIRNTRYQKTVNSEKEKNILKEVVVYTCNKIHRLCYLDVQEDPNNISKMIRKLYYLFVDSEYYKVLVKILNQTLNDSTGEDNWQTTELDIFIEKWMKLNNQKIQHSSVE